MNTETKNRFALTKLDIKKLRMADEVHARRSPKIGDDESASQLELTVNSKKDRSGFESEEKRSTVACRESIISYASKQGHKLLRENDEIELQWIHNNSCGYLDNAYGTYDHGGCWTGLHRDELNLIIWRKDQAKYAFKLKETVCPNNSARMIRG